MNKQIEIEKMQLLMLNSIDPLYFNTCEVKANNEKRFLIEATTLYNAGYRNASEVAREIFAEIANIIRYHDELAERDGSEYGELIVSDIGCALGELKKKYTEVQGDGT